MAGRINEKWDYRVRMNGVPRCLRERVADWLRALATKLDNRMTVAIEMRSTPPVPLKAKAACVVRGFRQAEKLFEAEVKAEALERGFKTIMPKLFDEV